MDKHTQGKWVTHSGAIWKDDGSEYPTVCLLKAEREGYATAPTERDANVKRTARCVNLLDGVSDKDIDIMLKLLEQRPGLLQRWIATWVLFNQD